MAIIRNTAAMRLRGRVGNTTYYTEGGRQIARVSQNASNYGETARRSEAQQAQRAKWANLVNFYKLSKAWMPKAYENKKRTQSDYNRFMQLNLSAASVYLTRDMYAQGGCVVEPFKISEGSLRSVQVSPFEDIFLTDLKLGTLQIDDTTSVSALTRALIDNNAHLHEGVQVSFVSYQQQLNPYGIPQVICTPYELTLDLENSTPARNYLPDFCLGSVQGVIATNEYISTGCFAYVISDSTSGKTLVSTQTLINNNSLLIGQYSTAKAREASIASYGVDSDVFLMSGSFAQKAAAGTQYVAGILNTQQTRVYAVESERVKLGDVVFNQGSRMTVEFSSTIEASASDISATIFLLAYKEAEVQPFEVDAISVDGKRLMLSAPSGVSDTLYISYIDVFFNGIEYIGSFDVPPLTNHE